MGYFLACYPLGHLLPFHGERKAVNYTKTVPCYIRDQYLRVSFGIYTNMVTSTWTQVWVVAHTHTQAQTCARCNILKYQKAFESSFKLSRNKIISVLCKLFQDLAKRWKMSRFFFQANMTLITNLASPQREAVYQSLSGM